MKPVSSATPVTVPREDIEGTCPECGARKLQRYKVLSAGGWFSAEKCQECLASLRRQPWNRLGYVDRSHADGVIERSQATREQ